MNYFHFLLPDFSDEEDDLDDELSELLLLEEVFPVEVELPDLPEDELPEELPVLPYDLECEPDEKDSLPELRLAGALFLLD